MKKAVPRLEKKLTPEQAIARLETMCARAERCTRELRDKLWQWGISTSDANEIITDLIKRRFVDDTRFARAFINDKVRFARWGRRKIRLALAAKFIDMRTIAELFNEIDESVYSDNLTFILKLKATGMSDPNTYEGRTKLFRHAISRGYEPDMVASRIKALFC